MVLTKLDIHHVRNIQHATIEPHAGLNFFYGANGSGKTALLEAIFILGRAKSFRNKSIKKVIQLNTDEIIIFGLTETRNLISSKIGIQLSPSKVEIRINSERNLSRSELAYELPLQIIHPKSYNLMDDGSRNRREFIDWGAFNLYEEFLPTWRKYNKILKQRNAMLKQKQISQLQVWNQEFAQYGTIVHKLRTQYVELLAPVFYSVVNNFMQFDDVQINLSAGWPGELSLAQTLNANLDKDLHYGYTHAGPHRADFKLIINSQQAKDFVSRGQMKLLILALKLAQVKLLFNQLNITTCILVDDISAELDKDNRNRLLHYLYELGSQVFITATHEEEFGDFYKFKNYKMFHVEHGNVIPT